MLLHGGEERVHHFPGCKLGPVRFVALLTIEVCVRLYCTLLNGMYERKSNHVRVHVCVCVLERGERGEREERGGERRREGRKGEGRAMHCKCS